MKNGKKALAPREKEIMALVVEGYTNKEIAEHLGISSHTVNAHLYRTYMKLAVPNRAAAAAAFLTGETA